jgi:phosphate starvation-inducible PhoH-like protein
MKKLEIPTAGMAAVLGDRDENFDLLERSFDVDLSMRGGELFVEGEDEAVSRFTSFLGQLLDLPSRGHEIQKSDIRTAIGLFQRNPGANLADYFVGLRLRPSSKKFVAPKSEHQRRYLESIRDSDLVFGSVPRERGRPTSRSPWR